MPENHEAPGKNGYASIHICPKCGKTVVKTQDTCPFCNEVIFEDMAPREKNLTLAKGCPGNIEERLEKEKRCYKMLNELGVEYYRVDHEAADTMEACQAIEDTLGTAICKNLFLCNRQHTQFYLLMMPGDKVFKTKELSGQLGCARLSFAESEYMEKHLDITPGSVSVLGLMNDHDHAVQLLVDEDLFADEYIGCHPCINTSTLKIKREELLGKVLPAMKHEMITVTLVGE